MANGNFTDPNDPLSIAESLLASTEPPEPEPITRKQRALGALFNALKGAAVGLRPQIGGPAPFDVFLARRQEELDRQTREQARRVQQQLALLGMQAEQQRFEQSQEQRRVLAGEELASREAMQQSAQLASAALQKERLDRDEALARLANERAKMAGDPAKAAKQSQFTSETIDILSNREAIRTALDKARERGPEALRSEIESTRRELEIRRNNALIDPDQVDMVDFYAEQVEAILQEYEASIQEGGQDGFFPSSPVSGLTLEQTFGVIPGALNQSLSAIPGMRGTGERPRNVGDLVQLLRALNR